MTAGRDHKLWFYMTPICLLPGVRKPSGLGYLVESMNHGGLQDLVLVSEIQHWGGSGGL